MKEDNKLPESNNELQREIIESIKAEQTLFKSEVRYRSLFENMHEGFAYCKILYDSQNNPDDFIYIVVNSSFERLTGLKDVIGKKVTEVIPGIKELNPELFVIYDRVAATGRPEKFELELKPMDMYLSISVYSTEREYFYAVFENITERKRAANVLNENNVFLQTLLNSIPVPVFYKDTEGRYIGFNKSFEMFYGKTFKELNGKTVFDAAPQDLAEIYHAKDMELFKHPGMQVYDSQMKDNNGVIHDVVYHKATFMDTKDQVRGIIGVILDITEHNRAKELLKESDEFNKSLLRTIPFGMDIIDENGNVLFFSNNFIDQFGKEAIGRKCWELYRDDKTQCRECPIKSEFKIGQTLITETSGVMNGKYFQIHHTGMVFNGKKAMLEVFQDITESKLTAQALQASEEKYRLLIENQGEGIGIVDINENFVFTNPAAEKIFGVQPGGLVGRNLNEFIAPEISPVISEETKKRSEGKKSTYEIEVNTGNYDKIYLLVTATPQVNKEGKYIGTFGVFRDITERKLAEIQLVKKTEELRTLNDAKDKFFSIIAHDLRGPFNTLLNLSEILFSEIDSLSKEEIKNFNEELHNSLTRQFELLNNLLDWSKMQDGRFKLNPRNVILYKEINKVMEPLELSASKKNIKLINNVEGGISVFADVNMIRLVLRNLISNGIKFTTRDGFVAVTAKKTRLYAQVIISDNGIGIAENDVEKLFGIENNYSTKGTENEIGTGLGLTLCKEIIEKHNGKIWVESEKNEGSNFIFTLPLKEL